MASKQDLDFTYTTMDKIFRLSMGETADFSGARYNGDFSLSLEEAQRAKHEFMASQLHIGQGSRVLDMGCGWGPFLTYVKELGANGIGLTLSDGQYAACRKNGLEVHLQDVRTVTPQDYGLFDAVVSVGAFEHFCSPEEYRLGKQEAIYRSFFKTVHGLLKPGGRFYLQTMVFGKNWGEGDAADPHAPKDSPAYLMALMAAHFPGSWLPYGPEMILRAAAPWFGLVNSSSGRLDYIETTNQWRKRLRRFSLRKYALYLSLLPSFILDRQFRHKLSVYRTHANKKCFEQEIMDHYRMVLEKK